ncbi:MAG: LysR substrate-binding domain-containing protein [Actinomycetota bacterium]
MNQIDGGTGGVSDRWLRVFVAAADAGSFTGAATNLGIGQPAVSHAVKRLEQAVGARLFDRTASGIALTQLGEELRLRIRAGFDVVDAAVRDAASQVRSDSVVTLSVSTALATYWLMPRLAAFKEAHPDVELRVITQDTDDGVGRDEADLWIPLGPGPWPALRTWHFADERLAPVASPAHVAATGVTSVTEAELLHNEERYRPRYDWRTWFEVHGIEPSTASAGQTSNDYSIVVHAALEGQGVALGWLHIVEPLLRAGRLERIGDDVVLTEAPFCVVARPEAIRRHGVDDLRRWLLDEAADLRSSMSAAAPSPAAGR